jgi:DnaJ-class molecular chaperone
MPENRPCPACEGDGWTFRGCGFERMECPACQGLGTVEATPVHLSPGAAVALVVAALGTLLALIGLALGA